MKYVYAFTAFFIAKIRKCSDCLIVDTDVDWSLMFICLYLINYTF